MGQEHEELSIVRRVCMLIVRSPVRISFAGGGTDLPAYYERFGGAVLSTSINKYFYTILQKRSDGKVQVISSDLRVGGKTGGRIFLFCGRTWSVRHISLS